MAFVDWCFIRFKLGACDECGRTVREKLWGNAERVVKYLLPNGHREAQGVVLREYQRRSRQDLKVNLAGKNVWSDFASGDSGDLLDLWVLVRNCSLHEAMREAKGNAGSEGQ